MQNNSRMEQYLSAVEAALQGCFAERLPQSALLESMRYSLLAGGKRIRPILTLEFCRLCSGTWEQAMPFACAMEMVHTYSLIHDDLPCMDNDDYRRGKLTNHKVYGEAGAVLAGDGLLTAAFETASNAKLPNEAIVSAIRILSACAGCKGMVGGQTLDLEGEHKHCTAEEISEIHRLKTGALIQAACTMGVAAGNGTEAQMQAAKAYAAGLGLAFQLRDDILDVIGDEAVLGKKTAMDEHKNTFVRLYGVERCEELVRENTAQAIRALSAFEGTNFLEELANSLAERNN